MWMGVSVYLLTPSALPKGLVRRASTHAETTDAVMTAAPVARSNSPTMVLYSAVIMERIDAGAPAAAG